MLLFFSDVLATPVKDAQVPTDDLLVTHATLGVRDVYAEQIRAYSYTNRLDRFISLGEPMFRTEVPKALDAVVVKSESPTIIYVRIALQKTELAMPGDAARDTLAVE